MEIDDNRKDIYKSSLFKVSDLLKNTFTISDQKTN